ncbi:hypothetical protein RJT34_07267 [Clitoria ternatea]|uniref:Uncharacterized protein n=1 Tax=Clitoria ternatea TaxID=43366 RepID=A0AAN9PUS2_CLITE
MCVLFQSTDSATQIEAMTKGKDVMVDHPPGFSPLPKHIAQMTKGKEPMVDVHDPEPMTKGKEPMVDVHDPEPDLPLTLVSAILKKKPKFIRAKIEG